MLDANDNIVNRRLSDYQIYYKLNLKFYNTNLKPLSYIKDVELNNQLIQYYEVEDLFIKSLYLNFMTNHLSSLYIVIFIFLI